MSKDRDSNKDLSSKAPLLNSDGLGLGLSALGAPPALPSLSAAMGGLGGSGGLNLSVGLGGLNFSTLLSNPTSGGVSAPVGGGVSTDFLMRLAGPPSSSITAPPPAGAEWVSSLLQPSSNAANAWETVSQLSARGKKPPATASTAAALSSAASGARAGSSTPSGNNAQSSGTNASSGELPTGLLTSSGGGDGPPLHDAPVPPADLSQSFALTNSTLQQLLGPKTISPLATQLNPMGLPAQPPFVPPFPAAAAAAASSSTTASTRTSSAVAKRTRSSAAAASAESAAAAAAASSAPDSPPEPARSRSRKGSARASGGGGGGGRQNKRRRSSANNNPPSSPEAPAAAASATSVKEAVPATDQNCGPAVEGVRVQLLDQPVPRSLFTHRRLAPAFCLRVLFSPSSPISAQDVLQEGVVMRAHVDQAADEAELINFLEPVEANGDVVFNNLMFAKGTHQRLMHLYFELTLPTASHGVLTVKSPLSEPFIVCTNIKQWIKAEFAVLKEVIFRNGVTSVGWEQFRAAIAKEFLLSVGTPRQLTEADFELIRLRVGTEPITQPKCTEFWNNWYGPSIKAIYQKHGHQLWSKGLVYGFMSARSSEQALRDHAVGTFMLRFADLPEAGRGQFVVSYVHSDHSVHHYRLTEKEQKQPFQEFLYSKQSLGSILRLPAGASSPQVVAKDDLLKDLRPVKKGGKRGKNDDDTADSDNDNDEEEEAARKLDDELN